MKTAEATAFFNDYHHAAADSVTPLAQSGSARQNWKISANGENYIVTFNENLRENESFFYFADLFKKKNLPAAQILAISGDRKFYLQNYLGAQTLSEIIQAEGESARVERLVTDTLQHLLRLQQETKTEVDYAKTFEYESYDRLAITHDLYYFKNFLADVLEVPYHKSSLLKEFESIAVTVENLQPKVLMLRDFQSRNIMVNEADSISFIDFQSAMEGPSMYDALSFLYQAKANFSEDFKNRMLDRFIGNYPAEEQNQLRNSVPWLLLMRYLQVLGAYGFRGLVQRKPHFLQSLPKGIENAKNLAEKWPGANELPELRDLIFRLASEEILTKINQYK